MALRKIKVLSTEDTAIVLTGMAIGLIHAAQKSLGIAPEKSHAFLEELANELDVLGAGVEQAPIQEVYALMSHTLIATEPVD